MQPTPIEHYIKQCDIALLDGTFYKNGELKRDMSEIPHPFIEESINRFNRTLTPQERAKVHFIHFNHTNPMLFDKSAQEELLSLGYGISKMEQQIDL